MKRLLCWIGIHSPKTLPYSLSEWDRYQCVRCGHKYTFGIWEFVGFILWLYTVGWFVEYPPKNEVEPNEPIVPATGGRE